MYEKDTFVMKYLIRGRVCHDNSSMRLYSKQCFELNANNRMLIYPQSPCSPSCFIVLACKQLLIGNKYKVWQRLMTMLVLQRSMMMLDKKLEDYQNDYISGDAFVLFCIYFVLIKLFESWIVHKKVILNLKNTSTACSSVNVLKADVIGLNSIEFETLSWRLYHLFVVSELLLKSNCENRVSFVGAIMSKA